MRTQIDHTALETAVGSLIEQSHEGVIDRHYTAIVENYVHSENNRKAATTLLSLLRRARRTTFSVKEDPKI